ncbi:MAG: phage portal protein, partial [Rhodospirillaceae bacterium]|nr:phage portal protein [Rhodospirillaceae bacterium]
VRVIGADGRPLATKPGWMLGRGEWDWDDMLSAVCWSFLMRGNAFLRPRRSANGIITYVGIVHPDAVSANIISERMRGGEDVLPQLFVNGQPVNVIQGRWITEPGNWKGLSPIAAARRAAYIGEAGQDAIGLHFSQGVRKQGALTTEASLGRRNKAETIAQMRARWSGVDQWWTPIVLDQGLKWTDLSMTAADAEFLNLSEWNDARIAGQIFHVDPTLLGIKQGGSTVTYRNAIDREAQLWRDALRPLATKVEHLFSELLPTGQRLDFDERGLVTGSPKDRIDQAQKLAQINSSQKRWVFSADDIRERAGFEPLGVMPAPLEIAEGDQLQALMDQLQGMVIEGEYLVESSEPSQIPVPRRELTDGR